jgi:hypothetical protein
MRQFDRTHLAETWVSRHGIIDERPMLVMCLIPRLNSIGLTATIGSMWRTLLVLLLAASPALSAKGKTDSVVSDLPGPFNLQAVVLNKSVSLAWEWQRPEQMPALEHFGFEVLRGTTPIGRTATLGYSDVDVPWGSHVYRVRVTGGAKERGRRVQHVSAWSEPAPATVKVTCAAAPTIELSVTPTKNSYSSIPALRLRLTGDVSMRPRAVH